MFYGIGKLKNLLLINWFLMRNVNHVILTFDKSSKLKVNWLQLFLLQKNYNHSFFSLIDLNRLFLRHQKSVVTNDNLLTNYKSFSYLKVNIKVLQILKSLRYYDGTSLSGTYNYCWIGKMSHHIQLESNMTLSGSNADKRIPLSQHQQKITLAKLYNTLKGQDSSGSGYEWCSRRKFRRMQPLSTLEN